MTTFETIRWIRLIMSSLFVVIAIAAISYWHIRDAKQIAVEQISSSCIVLFASDDTRGKI